MEQLALAIALEVHHLVCNAVAAEGGGKINKSVTRRYYEQWKLSGIVHNTYFQWFVLGDVIIGVTE